MNTIEITSVMNTVSRRHDRVYYDSHYNKINGCYVEKLYKNFFFQPKDDRNKPVTEPTS